MPGLIMPETRCSHGFMRSVAPCPTCGPADVFVPSPKKRKVPGSNHHPGFVEMVGRTIAGGTVLRRLANSAGNARWAVKLACGHERVAYGTDLRALEKSGGQLRCVECHTNRPITRDGEP